jgi:hypothetical protein
LLPLLAICFTCVWRAGVGGWVQRYGARPERPPHPSNNHPQPHARSIDYEQTVSPTHILEPGALHSLLGMGGNVLGGALGGLVHLRYMRAARRYSTVSSAASGADSAGVALLQPHCRIAAHWHHMQ